MMLVHKIRLLIQHLSFLVLMYGGRLGIHLGPALPCFACPYVTGCGGYCYLMGLQGYIGFGMGLSGLWGFIGLQAVLYLLLFVLLVVLLGKIWCGWICPMGLLNDWAAMLRRKLSIREMQISYRVMCRLRPIKYILLALLVVVPVLITAGILHEDFYLPFCSICPGKSLLPLFAGRTQYLALNTDNMVLLGLSVVLLIFTGITLAGMFFKERFFCIFCPMLALIHIFKPLTALRLIKEPNACIGCGNCRRSCPMEIQEVYLERTKSDVQKSDCLNCGNCVTACPSDEALQMKFFRLTLFASKQNRSKNMRKA